MLVSEVPLLSPFLAKNAGRDWAEVMEVTKLSYSAGGKAVYLRVVIGVASPVGPIHHYWREVADLDAKLEVIDLV
jgi:hypothetical protein